MPGTRGAAAAGLPLRGRAVTRERAGPRRATGLSRRPDAPKSASRRRAGRLRSWFGAVRALALFPGGRAGFAPRVFDLVLTGFSLAALFPAADVSFAAFFAFAFFFFFFLGLVVIRIAVSPRRAERTARDGARRRGGW